MRYEFLVYVALVLAAVLSASFGHWELTQSILLLAIFLAVVDFKDKP